MPKIKLPLILVPHQKPMIRNEIIESEIKNT
jgi:hypothetical protein